VTDPPGATALAAWAWREAAELLVLPPDPERAAPMRQQSAAALIEALVALTPPEQPDPGLALALLDHPWRGADLDLLRCQADALRRRLVGDQVTYVVNRNLNVSNHCVQHCSFCAFRRDPGQPGAYWLSLDDLQQRARQAQLAGATELCLQGGLNPEATVAGSQLAYAEQLLTALQQAAPGIHLHAFSPQELLFFAEQDGLPLETVLERLQRCGLGSVPGTAAEVLSQRVRQRLCPEKLSARAWVAVVLQVHRRGLASTCTLMAGHIEQPADLVAHLLTLVAVQAAARRRGLPGFSEFVLLPFIGAAAPAPLRRQVGRDQPDRGAMLRLTAQARLILGAWIPAHQPSWVKLGLDGATEALRWGCNDLGGTLMEEHITTMAGARGGTAQTPAALQAAARQLHRPVRQRTTLYGHL
jgi:5-amino-6-(D-ribitylamino)uracil---L-tyrosine 4-hydroxyphenyl transferase